MPRRRAASIRFVPAGTSISLPSMVSLGMGLLLHQRLELGAEFFDVRDVGADGAVVERADRGAGAALGHVEDRVEIVLARVPPDDATAHLVDPPGRLAARRACAATLVRVESRDDHE